MFPGRPLDLIYVALFTQSGPTLWQHLVPPFGAKTVVWAYNRVGHAIVHLARVLLGLLLFLYVDDYGAVDPDDLVDAGFAAFEYLSALFGFRLKVCRRKAPFQ